MAGTNSVGAVNTNSFVYNPSIDMDYDDMDVGMPMESSVFGYGYGATSIPPMMGGTCQGFNSDQYFQNMRNYQKFYNDYSVENALNQRNGDLRVNAPLEAVKNSASVLKDKILQNEQGQIEEAYKNYLKAVANAYGAGSESEIKARANTLYAEMNGGKTIIQDLRENSHGSFTQGFIQALTLGTFDSSSAEDNISKITGAPVGTDEKTKNNAGRIAGAATLGLTIGAIASKFGKVGKVVGFTVAGISLLASAITGKITT